MNSPVFHPALPSDSKLSSLVELALKSTDSIFYIANIAQRSLLAISPSCATILGYPPIEFLNGGAEFIFSLTEPSFIPRIVERQNQYLQQTRSPGFVPADALIMTFDTRLKRANQPDCLDLCCQAVNLNFNSDLDPELCCAFLSPYNKSILKRNEDHLQQLKDQHSNVYVHPPIKFSESRKIPVIHLTNQRQDLHITTREQEILQQLANGKSTEEIAKLLHVSTNTVETHRRHLLEKFQAKNVAELIKKASKVFWLE